VAAGDYDPTLRQAAQSSPPADRGVTQELRTFFDNVSNGQPAGPFQCAFPYRENAPAALFKPRHCDVITRAIPGNLVLPELFPCCGPFEQMAAVPVPEATVNEYDGVVLRKDEIRAAGQLAVLQAETETESMQGAADHHFRSRIASPDTAHIEPALLRCKYVHGGRANLYSCFGVSAHPSSIRG
jgi:hypothetical protein